MKRSSGMDCVVLTFHKDEKGTIVLNLLSLTSVFLYSLYS